MIHEKKTVQALDISAAIKLQQSVHFLIISINGEPAGRIIIGLHGEDVPARPAGFSNLVSGAAGISYRWKEFIKIMPNYEQHGGVTSYGVRCWACTENRKQLGSWKSRGWMAEGIWDPSTYQDFGWSCEHYCERSFQTASKVEVGRKARKPWDWSRSWDWSEQYRVCDSHQGFTRVGCIISDSWKCIGRDGGCRQDWTSEDLAGEYQISLFQVSSTNSARESKDCVLQSELVITWHYADHRLTLSLFCLVSRAARLLRGKGAVVAERGFDRQYSKVLSLQKEALTDSILRW